MTTTDKISVWFDGTSDDSGWIVSRDNPEGSDTLRVFIDRDTAMAYGRDYAVRRGLPLVSCDEHGVEKDITSIA